MHQSAAHNPPVRPKSAITGCTQEGIMPKSSPQISMSDDVISTGRVECACVRHRPSWRWLK